MEFCHLIEPILIGLGVIGFTTVIILTLWGREDKFENVVVLGKIKLKVSFVFFLLLCSITIILFGGGIIHKFYGKPDRCENPPPTNLDGEYFYLTTPHDKDQKLLLEKKVKVVNMKKGICI